MKRAFSCLIALSLWLAPLGVPVHGHEVSAAQAGVRAAPARAYAAPAAVVDYRAGEQSLVVEVPDGVVPGVQELSNPPRFVVDLPGAPPARPLDVVYAEGLVQRFVAVRRGDGTRIVLHLRAPLRDAWTVKMEGRRLVFVLSAKAPVPGAPTPVTAGKTPPPVATPAPRPTVRPTPRPKPRPAPKLSATPSPVPQLTPIEMPGEPEATGAVVPMATPTAAPTPAPTAKPQPTPVAVRKTPPPRPTPSPKPMASPTPAPRPGIRAVRPASGNYVRVGRITYDEATRFFTVPVSRRVTPAFTMENDPPQLVMDLPGAVVGPTQTRTFSGGLVTEAVAYQQTATSTRVVLTLARPIGQSWSLKQTSGKLILLFDHRPAALPQAQHPAPRPPSSAKTQKQAAGRPASPKPATPQTTAGKTFKFTGSIFSINSGVPIAGAAVNIGGRIARTNRDGQFSFPALPAGLHPVTVSAPGFATQKFNIVVPEDRTLSLNLVPALQ